MRKKLVLALLASVVLVSGCTTSQPDTSSDSKNNPGSESDPVQEEPKTSNQSSYTIEYTESGFQPSSLTINQGNTVTWVDKASSSMWVASDRHPVHSDYSGTTRSNHCSQEETEAFDQCETGEEYSFAFEKIGEWGYHNHEPFRRGGTITVVE